MAIQQPVRSRSEDGLTGGGRGVDLLMGIHGGSAARACERCRCDGQGWLCGAGGGGGGEVGGGEGRGSVKRSPRGSEGAEIIVRGLGVDPNTR